MARITIAVGILLILLGAVGHFGTGTASVTAWIPAFFGLPILGLGVLALRDSLRMHAMHFASMLALLGVIGSLYRPLSKMAAGEFQFSAAAALQFAMALICGVFLFLCVKSFVDARLRRKQDPE